MVTGLANLTRCARRSKVTSWGASIAGRLRRLGLKSDGYLRYKRTGLLVIGDTTDVDGRLRMVGLGLSTLQGTVGEEERSSPARDNTLESETGYCGSCRRF